MSKLQRPTGTLDYMPEDLAYIDYVTEKFENAAAAYGFEKYQTPTFEYTQLFVRGVGESSDIVTKEMFTFVPRKEQGEDKSVTLKPEGTAGMVRLYIQEGLKSKKPPVKMYYLTPCFRNERNQKGRFKEFHQLGVEEIGSGSPTTDAEVIALAATFFKALGILDDISLEINSVGTATTRKLYNEKLKAFLKPHYEKLCPDCKVRYEKNPMRVLDCKEKSCAMITKDAPLITDNLSKEEQRDFERVKKLLDIADLKYTVNKRIVRGLDYYSGTAFEFLADSETGAQAVCGGGRYDGLVELLGGGDESGVGFAIGTERLVNMLKEKGKLPAIDKKCDLYIAAIGDLAEEKAFEICTELREHGIYADMGHMGKSLKAQMKHASSINAKYVLILGDEELANKTAPLRDMDSSEQKETKLDMQVILSEIKK